MKAKKTNHRGEHELLARFARLIKTTKSSARGIIEGVGDDAAVIRPQASMDMIVSADSLVEGTHFKRPWFAPRELGWRLAAVCMSDIAAMGGLPLYGLLSLALPADVDASYATALERGVRDHLAKFGATIIGGNVTGTDGTMVCDLTVMGSCKKGTAWKRRCRSNRDAIVVVGNLGQAAAGLSMLQRKTRDLPFPSLVRSFKRPTPLFGIRRIAGSTKITGAIDVSDGFSSDLTHLANATASGFEVDAASLPISNVLRRYGRWSGVDVTQLALHGGEDYALILSIDSRRAEAVAQRIQKSLNTPARIVGRFTSRQSGRVLIADGTQHPLRPQGWDHLKRSR